MKQNILDILEECIQSINAGYSPESFLKRHPEYTKELSEFIKTITAVSELRVDNISAQSIAKSQLEFISRAKSLALSNRDDKENSLNNIFVNLSWRIKQMFRWFSPAAFRFSLAIAIAMVFLLMSGGLLITSAKSLPGDSLYPVKLAVEDLRFYLAANINRRHEYETSYTQQRIDEVKSLLEMGRTQRVSFESLLISMSESNWNVGGIDVEVRGDTLIAGGIGGTKSIEPGMEIEIEGRTNPNGWVDADEIHIREYQFIGSVDKIGNSFWTISGIRVIIPATVHIDEPIKAGDDVFVNVHSEDSGLYAISIQRVNHAASTPTLHHSPIITLSSVDNTTDTSKEKYTVYGNLEEIKSSYWIVSGEIFFIVPNTEVDREIKIGDHVKLEYIIENNGSFTAIHIERSENGEDDGGDEQKTPEPTEIESEEATSEVTKTDEHLGGDHTPEPSETPKPSETPEPDN